MAKAIGSKFVLSTISHPIDGIRAMYRYGNDSFYAKLRKLGVPESAGLAVREGAKSAAGGHISRLLRIRSLDRMQQAVLDMTDLVLAIASGEARALSSRFTLPHRPVVLPNALGFGGGRPPSEESTSNGDILVVGRVEPRKNTLEMARACERAGLRVIFAGAINENHRSYSRAFLKLIASSDHCSYLGHVGREELRSHLERARAYVNPSWFEVVSLADCEAAAMGVPVVTSVHSYIDDLLPNVSRIDPVRVSMDADGSYLASCIESARVVEPPPERTWDQVGEELLDGYRSVL
ncbi:glycosyltransferase family 4 protein [Microbacterium sp. VKM Ac-2870]|uniref:glycosyltransferase n=1 Tax=Microbacterium sp. VKM Ac-2870 TaxID=2783825 RepID=UPI00188BF169|nr:glycosyltransferase [Microbacterium sp. VKM Ac-2870]MBF4561454.1 glycosyltransferase family 4 protein [Microbacterium sp. VKM Ac-2870]